MQLSNVHAEHVILQTTPLVAGLAIGAAAYAGRALLQVGSKWSTAGSAVGRSFYKVSLLLLLQTGRDRNLTTFFYCTYCEYSP